MDAAGSPIRTKARGCRRFKPTSRIIAADGPSDRILAGQRQRGNASRRACEDASLDLCCIEVAALRDRDPMCSRKTRGLLDYRHGMGGVRNNLAAYGKGPLMAEPSYLPRITRTGPRVLGIGPVAPVCCGWPDRAVEVAGPSGWRALRPALRVSSHRWGSWVLWQQVNRQDRRAGFGMGFRPARFRRLAIFLGSEVRSRRILRRRANRPKEMAARVSNECLQDRLSPVLHGR